MCYRAVSRRNVQGKSCADYLNGLNPCRVLISSTWHWLFEKRIGPMMRNFCGIRGERGESAFSYFPHKGEKRRDPAVGRVRIYRSFRGRRSLNIQRFRKGGIANESQRERRRGHEREWVKKGKGWPSRGNAPRYTGTKGINRAESGIHPPV